MDEKGARISFEHHLQLRLLVDFGQHLPRDPQYKSKRAIAIRQCFAFVSRLASKRAVSRSSSHQQRHRRGPRAASVRHSRFEPAIGSDGSRASGRTGRDSRLAETPARPPLRLAHQCAVSRRRWHDRRISRNEGLRALRSDLQAVQCERGDLPNMTICRPIQRGTAFATCAASTLRASAWPATRPPTTSTRTT